MLEELGVPYENLPVHFIGDAQKPEYMKINPNGHIPALDDDGLAMLGALPAVTDLRLSRNRLTERGVATLARWPKLESLNLYGNSGITDASIETLSGIPPLRRVYLWQTGVTDAGAAKLRATRPNLVVQRETGREISAIAQGEPAPGR